MFGFLGVGTQTEVAQAYGKDQLDRTRKILSLSLLLSVLSGLLLILIIFPTANWLAGLLGASGAVQSTAVRYMQIRLLGAPAVLLMLAIFGALRGVQDMKSPLWIALGVNGLNIILDWMLIFGKGPIPPLGVSGSALASTISQWLGALAGLALAARKMGLSSSIQFQEAVKLLKIGRDMFIRTGMLNLFLGYTTRSANTFGADAGAAHQVIRQVWVFTALALDAYAATVQSLIGFFIGQGSASRAKFVVQVALIWSLGTGTLLSGLMWLGKDLVVQLLVPISAVSVFLPAWLASTISQPLNAVAFLTDGVHMGTGDYAFLRNAILAASLVGIAGLWVLERWQMGSLVWVWILVMIWISLRGLLGMLRIWPGIGNSPFREAR
jgi:MATE family multidrug resistance protein